MLLKGYVGICACCFAPIRKGQDFKFRSKGRKFHKDCIEKNPDSYYIKLEKRLAEK